LTVAHCRPAGAERNHFCENAMNTIVSATLPLVTILAALIAGHAAQAQSAGGLRDNARPMGNPATPMQQMPSGTIPGTGATETSDQQFALEAAIANKFQVIEGELALQRTSDPKLKELARTIVKDHKVALQELQTAVEAGNVSLPVDIALDQARQAKINAMKDRTGADFNQAYRSDQIQAHERMLALLDSYAQVGGDPSLKAWAGKTLTMVRRHSEHLKSLGLINGWR
jgi:putative membrane protein